MLDPAFWSTKLVCDPLPRRTVLHQSCKSFILFWCPTRPLMANRFKATLKYSHPCATAAIDRPNILVMKARDLPS